MTPQLATIHSSLHVQSHGTKGPFDFLLDVQVLVEEVMNNTIRVQNFKALLTENRGQLRLSTAHWTSQTHPQHQAIVEPGPINVQDRRVFDR
jgi:hypothetical protein